MNDQLQAQTDQLLKALSQIEDGLSLIWVTMLVCGFLLGVLVAFTIFRRR